MKAKMRKARAKTYLIMLIVLSLITAAALMTGCGRNSGAEDKVRETLDSMSAVDVGEDADAEIRDVLADEDEAYYDRFLEKAGEFEYKITGSEKADSSGGDGDAVTVHVTVTTYDFAREYLRSWSDFLDESGTGSGEYDSSKLYGILFKNLSSVEKKDYVSNVDVECVQDEDGNWQTDAASNAALKNALLGGMINEISSLAGI